jgi:hypothetical protein
MAGYPVNLKAGYKIPVSGEAGYKKRPDYPVFKKYLFKRLKCFYLS